MQGSGDERGKEEERKRQSLFKTPESLAHQSQYVDFLESFKQIHYKKTVHKAVENLNSHLEVSHQWIIIYFKMVIMALCFYVKKQSAFRLEVYNEKVVDEMD